MATKFDKIFRPLATKLIDNTFGTSAVLTKFTDVYSVSTGTNARTGTNTTVKISPPAPVAASRQTGVIEQGDAATMMAAENSVAPTIEDTLTWAGDDWKIVQVNTIVSGDQNAAYEMIIRK